MWIPEAPAQEKATAVYASCSELRMPCAAIKTQERCSRNDRRTQDWGRWRFSIEKKSTYIGNHGHSSGATHAQHGNRTSAQKKSPAPEARTQPRCPSSNPYAIASDSCVGQDSSRQRAIVYADGDRTRDGVWKKCTCGAPRKIPALIADEKPLRCWGCGWQAAKEKWNKMDPSSPYVLDQDNGRLRKQYASSLV